MGSLLVFALLNINGFLMVLITGITFSFLLYPLVTYKKSTGKSITILENKPLEFLGKYLTVYILYTGRSLQS